MPGYYLGQYWFRQLFSFNLPLIHSYIFTYFYPHFNFLTNRKHIQNYPFFANRFLKRSTSTGDAVPFGTECVYLVPGKDNFSSLPVHRGLSLRGTKLLRGRRPFLCYRQGFFCFYFLAGKGTNRGLLSTGDIVPSTRRRLYGGSSITLVLLSFPCRLFCQEKIFIPGQHRGDVVPFTGERGWFPLFARSN